MNVYDYIKKETNPDKLYDGVREILRKMDERGRYPQDHTIKKIQCLTDARYTELTEHKHKKSAEAFTEVIKALANSPEKLEKLEIYLSQHFDTWLEEYASTPNGLIYELRSFAEMEV